MPASGPKVCEFGASVKWLIWSHGTGPLHRPGRVQCLPWLCHVSGPPIPSVSGSSGSWSLISASVLLLCPLLPIFILFCLSLGAFLPGSASGFFFSNSQLLSVSPSPPSPHHRAIQSVTQSQQQSKAAPQSRVGRQSHHWPPSQPSAGLVGRCGIVQVKGRHIYSVFTVNRTA